MAKPLILSLDIATRTGVAEGRVGEAPQFYTENFTADTHETSFARCACFIIDRLRSEPLPDAVFAATPLSPGSIYGHTNADTTRLLIGYWAIISGLTIARGILFKEVNEKTARVAFLGRGCGNLRSEEAKRRAYDLCHMIGWSPSNRDEGDAGCIHFYACGQMGGLALRVSPMMRQKVATTVGGVEFKAGA